MSCLPVCSNVIQPFSLTFDKRVLHITCVRVVQRRSDRLAAHLNVPLDQLVDDQVRVNAKYARGVLEF